MSEVRRHATGDGQGAEGPSKRKFSAEEDGGRVGSGHGDPQGSREGKLVSLARRWWTVTEVRRRLGPEKISERRACRVLGQLRSTQRYQSRRPNDEPR